MTIINENQTYSSESRETTQAFVDSIGVNVHMTWTDTAYGDVSTVEDSLSYLGVDQVRDAAPPDWLPQPFDELADDGIHFDFLIPVTDGQTDVYGSIDRMAAFEQDHPGSISTIEGPNEVNTSPAPWNGSSSLSAEAQLQRDLHNAVQDNATLSDIPVADLTLASVGPSGYTPLGNLSSAVELGNAHIYFPSGEAPNNIWQQALDTGLTPTPNEPAIVTETGYYNMPDGVRGVDSTVQAKYTLDLLMDAAESGVKTTYLYQLIDHFADSGSNSELHYGLFNNDGSPKPVATAIHNLTSIMESHGDGAAQADASFNYSFSNLPQDTHELTFAAADGSTDLVVWAEPEIWNNSSQSAVAAKTYETTLHLDGNADISVYDPMTGTTAVQTADDSGSVTFELSDHPVIINVSDASAIASGESGTDTAATAGDTNSATTTAGDTEAASETDQASSDGTDATDTAVASGEGTGSASSDAEATQASSGSSDAGDDAGSASGHDSASSTTVGTSGEDADNGSGEAQAEDSDSASWSHGWHSSGHDDALSWVRHAFGDHHGHGGSRFHVSTGHGGQTSSGDPASDAHLRDASDSSGSSCHDHHRDFQPADVAQYFDHTSHHHYGGHGDCHGYDWALAS